MNQTELKALRERITGSFDRRAIETLIEYYHAEKNYEELELLYQRLLEEDGRETGVLAHLAAIYTDYYHDYNKAKDYYVKILEITPHDEKARVRFASFLEFHLKDYQQAEAEYKKAIRLDKTDGDAYVKLSFLYLTHMNDANRAYKLIIDALEAVKTSELYAQKGFIEFSKRKDFISAYASLAKAVELDPKNDLAHTYFGMAAVLEEKYDEAVHFFEAALKTGKLNEMLVYEYGKLLITRFHDLDKAVSLLEQATTYFPDNVIYYCYLANLNFVKGEFEKSKAYLRKAEEFEITSQEALLMVGYLKVMLNDKLDDALWYFEKVIELNPNNINALSIIGFYNLLNNEHIDLALENFKRIAAMNPDYFIINFIIAQIYLQYYQDYDKALDYFLMIDQSQLSKPDLARLYIIIGNIYEIYLNENNMALDFYEKAYEVEPNEMLLQVINGLYEKDKTLIN